MTKENITERVKGGGVSTAPSISKVGTGGSGGRNNPTTKLNPGKVTPQSQIRKIDPAPFNRSAASVTSTSSGDNLKSGSFGISKAGRDQAAQNRAEFKAKIDAVKASSNKSSTPVVSDKTKQGKPRTKAQMMAAKRIASGKTIADVKKANMDAMRARAAEKFADFKAKREAKRLERMKEEYTPYDMVLEYLLSTEQVATIEEANYVMMQLDEEYIQEVVGTVAKLGLKGLKAVGKFGAKSPLHFAALAGTTAALAPSVGKGLYKAKETVGNIANTITNFDPIGDARKKNIEAKQKKYREKSGTTKDDGYFYDPTIDKKR